MSLNNKRPRNVTDYSLAMIKVLKHKGLRSIFETGNKSGIQTHHVPLLTRQLVRLDVAKNENDLNIPSWKLHILTGELSGYYSITVNGN